MPKHYRARPIITRATFNATITALGDMVAVTPITELAQTARPIHIETLQVSGVIGTLTDGQFAAGYAALKVLGTSGTKTATDTNVRLREVQIASSGIPFLFNYKNINVGPGEKVTLNIVLESESDSGATYKVVGAYKVVYRELRQ